MLLVSQKANKEIINFRNKEGWEKYKEQTNKVADSIVAIVQDETLNINKAREVICKIDEKLQKECFSTIWVKQSRRTKTKPKQKKVTEELFNEQLEELMELIRTGASYKYANLRLWKMKELICGPKVGPAEPACINNPTTGELITNKES